MAKKVFVLSLNIVLCFFSLCGAIYLAWEYLFILTVATKNQIGNMLIYFLIFVFLPVITFFVHKKNKDIRLYLLICVIILVLISTVLYFLSLSTENFVKYDFETYLNKGTSFEQGASDVMPSKQSLENAQITFYQHTKHNDKETLRMSAVYSEQDFLEAKQKMDQQYQEHDIREAFYLDGLLYNCFVLYVNGETYALAYNICSDSLTISYIFDKDYQYAFMRPLYVFQHSYNEYRVMSFK